MGGSAADTPTTPEFLRASDAERDRAVDELRNEFAEGRLSQDTFLFRMHTALGARNRGQLASLFADLPPRRPPLSEQLRAAWRGMRRKQGRTGTDQAPGSQASPRAPGLKGRREIPRDHGAASRQAPRRPAPAAPEPLFFPPGSGTRFTIGRTNDCDLRLTDLSVSRRHAELTRGEDGWLLSDVGSHNGTRLNGWLIHEPVPVRAGDRVEFGSAMFIMRDSSAIES